MDNFSINEKRNDKQDFLINLCNDFFEDKNALQCARDSVSKLITFVPVNKVEMRINFKNDANTRIFNYFGNDISEDCSTVYSFFHSYGFFYTVLRFYREGKDSNYTSEEESLLKQYSQILTTYVTLYIAEKELDKSYTTDSMTGIGNRMCLINFLTRLNVSKKADEYVGVYLNIKAMKLFNQRYSSTFGDIILKAFASQLSGCMNRDELAIRLGGDNYIILIKKSNFDKMMYLLQPFCLTLTQYKNAPVDTVYLKFHMGVYKIPGEIVDIESFFQNITVALNSCKMNRSAEYIEYSYKIDQEERKVKQIEEKLDKALKENEFVVYIQPKVALKNYKLCGGEALVRWIHQGSLVMPNDFIPIAERSGVICDIDFWVYENVCKLLRKWIDQGIEVVPISCNFSRMHLSDDQFFDKLVNVAEKYRISTNLIEVELTEMIYISNLDLITDFINGLRQRGFRTSIDDFGSGYSSLNMLKNVKTDVIKLDKEFMSINNDSTPDERIIIQSIVNMSKNLNMSVVSEGVETKKQADFLKNIECNTAQGYYFSRPVEVSKFEEFLHNKDFAI